MAFSWSSNPSDESRIKREVMQEIVDNIDYLENRLDAGCDTKRMNPSDRYVENVSPSGEDPLRQFSGWRPNMNPTFSREYVEDEDLKTFRDAIDPLYDYRDVCRVHFGGDYQAYRTSLESTYEASYCVNVGDNGDVGDRGNNNDDNDDNIDGRDSYDSDRYDHNEDYFDGDHSDRSFDGVCSRDHEYY